MATVIERPNGTYLIRIYCGRDGTGKQVIKSKVFTPSRPGLTYSKLKREVDDFTKKFEAEVAASCGIVDNKKVPFATFCQKYLSIKKGVLVGFFHVVSPLF